MPDQPQIPSYDLWAITTYFNPCSYRSRYENYQTFRKHLQVPLLTVELAYGDAFELADTDATKLIQLRSDQVMWQKERLINLALPALPPDCKKVAWLDCDIIFERDDWAHVSSQALEDSVLVQLFSRVGYLNSEVDYSQPLADQCYVERESFASGYAAGNIGLDGQPVAPAAQIAHGFSNQYSNGFAWAMRREILEEVGLYDAMILGNGDSALHQAATGQAVGYARQRSFNAEQTRHYLHWARKCHRIVDSRIGVVSRRIFTLWHGQLQDRNGLLQRSLPQRFHFDPFQDIALDESGCWRWNSDKSDLHKKVKAFFRERKEDGR